MAMPSLAEAGIPTVGTSLAVVLRSKWNEITTRDLRPSAEPQRQPRCNAASSLGPCALPTSGRLEVSPTVEIVLAALVMNVRLPE